MTLRRQTADVISQKVAEDLVGYLNKNYGYAKRFFVSKFKEIGE